MVQETPSTMMFIQAVTQDASLHDLERRVLLTLEQTQGRYTLLRETYPRGSRSSCKTTDEELWSCFVVAGAFAFQQEGNVHVERFVANPGDVVALPSSASYRYELSDEAQFGQLLIFRFPATHSVPQLHLARANEGRKYAVITDIGSFKLQTQDTAGAYILMVWHVPPQGGPAMHAQSGQETFYIIEGNFTFRGLNNGSHYSMLAKKGDLIHAQERVSHSYQNTGEVPGKMLVIMSPAGTSQQFFEEIGTAVTDDTFPTTLPDLTTLLQIIQKYNVDLFA